MPFVAMTQSGDHRSGRLEPPGQPIGGPGRGPRARGCRIQSRPSACHTSREVSVETKAGKEVAVFPSVFHSLGKGGVGLTSADIDHPCAQGGSRATYPRIQPQRWPCASDACSSPPEWRFLPPGEAADVASVAHPDHEGQQRSDDRRKPAPLRGSGHAYSDGQDQRRRAGSRPKRAAPGGA